MPIRYSRPVRKRLLGAAKAMKKGPAGALGLLKGLKLKDLAPEAPSISNFTTGEVMGHERVVRVRFNMSIPRARVPEKASTLRERSER